MTIDKDKQRPIFVPAETHRKLKQVASHLDMTMSGLLTDVANGMLPLVLRGENPLSSDEEKEE